MWKNQKEAREEMRKREKEQAELEKLKKELEEGWRKVREEEVSEKVLEETEELEDLEEQAELEKFKKYWEKDPRGAWEKKKKELESTLRKKQEEEAEEIEWEEQEKAREAREGERGETREGERKEELEKKHEKWNKEQAKLEALCEEEGKKKKEEEALMIKTMGIYHNSDSSLWKKRYGEKLAILQNMSIAKQESFIREEIRKEKYGTSILNIKFTGAHFWYKSPSDLYIPGECGLYAARRLLHHAGQLGYVDKNLWDKYSDQEFRDILTDRLVGAREAGKEFLYAKDTTIGYQTRMCDNMPLESCRRRFEYLDFFEIQILLRTLGVPHEYTVGLIEFKDRIYGSSCLLGHTDWEVSLRANRLK